MKKQEMSLLITTKKPEPTYSGGSKNEVLKFSDLDEAIIGYTVSNPVRVVYSYGKIRDILMDMDGGTYEEVEEYIDYNLAGAYLGPETPVIVKLEE